MACPIVIYPNEILEKRADPIVAITDEIIEVLDVMYETMVEHDGVGLAAPQIGKSLQIAVVEIDEEAGGLFELINPKIMDRKGKEIDVEGCLSFPDIFGTVERAEEVTVSYYDREGNPMEVVASGYLARAFQHEIEHLEGQLFIDKIIERIAPEDLDTYAREQIND